MKYLVFLFILVSCVELTEIEKEERDFKRDYEWAETYNKWLVCKAAYLKAGIIWYSRTSHSRHIRRKPTTMDMKREMSENGCRIKDY